MESLVREEKLVRIKAYQAGRKFIVGLKDLVCFNTHIELAWTEMSQTVCLMEQKHQW